ncbi:hypothetical protein [Micromonospora sp. M51]|uniref:hypothetical protein n=1 Tax=Micromonospora sp. M51 TaxID=2824889 RepID=UPI001B393546|nr:hypothetical protein [Micromonospora sp. M51]
MALGAAALGAALGASPAHADSPSPSRLPPLEVATSPQALSVSVDDVVEVQLDVPLPVRTTAVPLPLPSTDPLPLPSIEPPPLPVPTLSARPVPTVSARPATTAPRRPARAPSSPRTTPTPAASVPPAVRVDQSAPSTVSPGGAHGRSDGRASDRARPTTATVTGERPVPPARPAPGPPVFVVALATGPATTSTGGAEPPPSTAEAPPSIPLLRAGFTVSAVDLRATGLPVERGPPPPR